MPRLNGYDRKLLIQQGKCWRITFGFSSNSSILKMSELLPASETPPKAKPQKRGIPEGLWLRCPGCNEAIFRKEMERRLNTCPECDHHFYVSALQRVEQVLDVGTF